MSERVPVVVLAGGRAKPELEAIIGTSDRSQAIVAGKSLLNHAVDAIHGAEQKNARLGPIAVVGNPPTDSRYACIADTGDFVGNMFAGLQHFHAAPLVLVVSADLPFLTGDGVATFVSGGMELIKEQRADLVWPIVPVQLCYTRYPGIRRTAMKIREGHYTGGNVALMRPAFMLAQRDKLMRAFAARKSLPGLARILGAETLARLLISQKIAPQIMTLAYLEQKIGSLLGGNARALITDLPELATDLDRPSDFLAVQSQSL